MLEPASDAGSGGVGTCFLTGLDIIYPHLSLSPDICVQIRNSYLPRQDPSERSVDMRGMQDKACLVILPPISALL